MAKYPMRVPDWLDDDGKLFWHRHKHRVREEDRDEFAIMADLWAEYVNAADLRSKKIYSDQYLKYSKKIFKVTAGADEFTPFS